MQTTVGVPTYGRPDDLDRLLDVLLTGSVTPDEVVVVDDGDSDETAAVVDGHRSSVDADVRFRYIPRSDSDGLPGARNVILEHCRGDVLCFLDDDTLPRSDWLAAIVETYESDPSVGAVGGPALHATCDCRLERPIDSSEHNRNVVTTYGDVNLAARQWVPPRPVTTDVLVGANMSFRTDLLSSLGGFDTGYGGTAAYEEVDVMARLGSTGHDIVYHPAACVYHFKRPTGGVRTGHDGWDTRYWSARNEIRFRWKHFRDRFPTALVRTACWTYGPASDWRESLAAVVGRFLEGQLGKATLDTHPSGLQRSGAAHRHDWWRSLFRSYGFAPLWKRLLDGLRRRDPASLGWIVGYIDGLRYETDLDVPGLDGWRDGPD